LTSERLEPLIKDFSGIRKELNMIYRCAKILGAFAPGKALALALMTAIMYGTIAQANDVTVVIDPKVRHQTILGWSATPWNPRVTPELRDQVVDELVNELGLTRLRWGHPSGNRGNVRNWEWENDDGDPFNINWSAFSTEAADAHISRWILPFKRRVEANGDPFELWISPSFFDGGSSGSVPAWLLHNPGEYAEYATSLLLYLKDKYGIEANHYVICNEAGNNNAFSPAVVGRMIKTLGPGLRALGLPTRIQFPDCVNAHASWRYIQTLKDDPEVWEYTNLITYHWYGKNNQDSMTNIRDFALLKGLPTGQTEYMSLTINHLYDDLTLGGVSYWSIYGMRRTIEFQPNNTSFRHGPQFWNFRQVMHYVRPGVVRVEAISHDPAVRALAFISDGGMTAVLINKALPEQPSPPDSTVIIKDLPPGEYGVCQTVRNRTYEGLGVQTVGDSGTLTVQIPSDAILTVYPYSGANQPPTVVHWEADPNFLTAPASSVALSASATDPEQDSISYAWAIADQPENADAVLTNPETARTSVTGLMEADQYIFTLTVSDGTDAVTRDVILNVYADNQPPMLIDVHNRIPVMVTLPQNITELRGGASDLEDDPLTYRWIVVSQPPGASVSLETPNVQKCKASNMTVAGDYVFRLEVSDPTHTVSEDLTMTVYPENTAPVISNAAASPADLTLPDSATVLSATTSDPDGDVISHWWSVKSAPTGVKPVFANQGSRKTEVSGLNSTGTYVFTLTTVDRTKFMTRDISVTVTP
jgi:hypothetical protein